MHSIVTHLLGILANHSNGLACPNRQTAPVILKPDNKSTWQGIAAAVLSSRATRPKFKNIQSPSGNGDPHPEQKNGAIKSGRCHPLPPCTRDAYRWQDLLQVLHHALNSCQEEFKLKTGAKNLPSTKSAVPFVIRKKPRLAEGG